MSTLIVLLVVLAIFLILAMAEAPVALAIASAAVTGIILTDGWGVASSVLGSTFYTTTANYSLFVIPMYVLLGSLIANAGIGAQIYRAINMIVGRLPGGLAATAVGATAMFSGISGSSSADVATFGRISVGEMARYGYSKSYASAVVASAGTFANLIPPSVGLIVFGILAEESLGKLLIAGLVPGILSAVILATFVIVRAALAKPGSGRSSERSAEEARTSISIPPESTDTSSSNDSSYDPEVDQATATDIALAKGSNPFRDFAGFGYGAIIFTIVIGGLYGGYFTATEAGAVGALAALVISLTARPSGFSRRRIMGDSLRETASISSMIFLFLIAGAILSYFVASQGYASDLASWAVSLDVPPKVVIIVMLLLMLPLGMFLDGLSLMLLTVPLFIPVVHELGFDPVWFGILVLKTVEVALITPPVGINVFIVSGVVKVPAAKIFRDIVPFVILDLCVTCLFFAFPEITLWLPRVAGY